MKRLVAFAALGIGCVACSDDAAAPTSRDASAAQAATPRAQTVSSPRVAAKQDAVELEAAKKRIAELEAELAVAKEKAATLDSMDPLGVLVYAKKDLAWKTRELLKIPERDRWAPMAKVAQATIDRPGGVDELLAALKSETDPEAMKMLAYMAGALSSQKTTAEQRAALVDLLKTGESPARRAAAVKAILATNEQQRQNGEPIPAFIDAIRNDPSPEVVGAIADSLANWFPPKEAVAAFDEVLPRMSPGPDRRKVLIAIGRGTFMGDHGADLFRRFAEAPTQEMRDDVAAAIARAANSMGGGVRAGETAEQYQERIRAAKAQFATVYQGTAELKIRQDLVRASQFGLNVVSYYGQHVADCSAFLRELVPLEPDATQKTRLEALAKAVDAGALKGSGDFDKILYGRD